MRSELKRRQCEEENKSTYVTNSAYLVTFVVHVCNFYLFFFFAFFVSFAALLFFSDFFCGLIQCLRLSFLHQLCPLI